MTAIFEKCKRAIEAQKKKDQISVGVAYVLEELARESEHNAEIILQDLSTPEMAVDKCAAQLWDQARKKKAGNCYFMAPMEATGLIREFYGLPAADNIQAKAPAKEPEAAPVPTGEVSINLLDFLG